MTVDRKARVLDVQAWDDHYLLSIASPEVGRSARPGQFVMLKVAAEPFPLLRRPLSIHDADGTGVRLFFKVAGLGTEILARKRPGDPVDLLGPLGRGYTVSASLKGKTAYLVGVGRGIAPLYFLGRELRALGAEVVVLYGGRTGRDIPLSGRFEAAGFRVLCSTDDGSRGFPGFVTGLLRRELARAPAAMIYVCGPDPMMKDAATAARAAGVAAEMSLEALMGCGIGACWGCVQRIRNEGGDGWVKICEEGPVFPAERVVWTEGRP
jgi:dihydroorotate dehydrogenase electron transfer subunit